MGYMEGRTCDISCKITYDNIKQLSIENDQLSCANSCMEEKKKGRKLI